MSVVLEEKRRYGLIYVTWFFFLFFLGGLLRLQLLIGFYAGVFWTDYFLCDGKFTSLLCFPHFCICWIVSLGRSIASSVHLKAMQRVFNAVILESEKGKVGKISGFEL